MNEHDLIIIGGGPGGYVAAIRAAQLGLDVACVEVAKKLGGVCLRVGCIPSKALLESSEKFAELNDDLAARGIVVEGAHLDLGKMLKHKDRVVTALTGGVDSLFKKNKITRYHGYGRLAGPGKVTVTDGEETTELSASKIIISTGSEAATLPGVELDGDRIGTSTEALAYPEVPEHLVVIGAGAIGLEMGTVWQRLGAKVTILEYLDRILPGMDADIAAEALKIFKKQGLTFHLGCKVTSATTDGKQCRVEYEGGEPLQCDRVLVAVGRKPNTADVGLESVGVETDKRGFIVVDEHFATAAEGVYAIGDVIGGAMLAHKAEEEGVACVEQLVNGYGHVNYNTIPAIVYTTPEVASVGKTEEQLNEAGVSYRKGEFPFIANGRARAIGHTEGKVKILADEKTDRILGVHIIGPHAGDLIAEAAVAMEFGASSEDLARSCHAHPTLAEVVKEAALAVDGRALHI